MLAEIPPGWTAQPLERLGTLHKGRGGPKSDDEPSGMPVIRYGELYTHHNEVVRSVRSFVPAEKAENYTPLRPGDVLFAGAGETAEEIGKSAVFLGPAPAYASGDLVIFRPNGQLDPLFLGYASNGPAATAYKQSVGQGSSILHIYSRDLQALELLVPPLPEQRKIAAILSSVDDAIAATGKVIEQTKRVKQGLLQALMTRGIGHTRFKKTEIGEIPESWELVPLGDVCAHITKGATPTTYGYQWIESGDDGVLFLRSECVSEEGFQLRGSERIPEPAHASMSRSEIRGDDVLVTITGNVGRVGQVPEEIERGNINQHLARVRVEARELFQDFVHLALQTKRQRNRFETIVTGLAYPQLSLKQIRETIVPMPRRAEQEEIVERIAAIKDVIVRSERSLAAWQKMKRGLMQDLLTGRVRVQTD